MGFLKSFYDPLGLGKKLGKAFSDKNMFGTDPSILKEIVPDPYKTKVSGPLSDFLSKQIGQGIGEFPTDPNYTNRYNEFLSMNPAEYFDANIGAPATQRFKEDFLPIIRESHAGNLRGSGRFTEEHEGINRFSQDLAMTKAGFVPEFHKQQIDVGQSEFARRYENWYNGLAVNNPALKSSIDFLNSDSGYNILSALDPGKQGWFQDLIKAAASAGAGAAASGCWVASELFGGWFEERTVHARYYINVHAPEWFRSLYMKYGEQFAAWLRKHPFMKNLIMPLFEYFAKRGEELYAGH